MKIHALRYPPSDKLADALAAFEEQFCYPLGNERSFRVSHGADYSQFFRAIDPKSGVSFVAADRKGEVLGTLGLAVRPLRLPDGTVEKAAYIGDLKVRSGTQRPWVLFRLALAALQYEKCEGLKIGYGVVMEGTPHSPAKYTGRAGIPTFRKHATVAIFRVPLQPDLAVDRRFIVDRLPDDLGDLNHGLISPLGGASEIRSQIPPIYLFAPDESACAKLEDTMMAKRLYEKSREMINRHLSMLHYRSPSDAAAIIRQALAHCLTVKKWDGLFFSVPSRDGDAMEDLLREFPGTTRTGARIYATGLDIPETNWSINTADI